MKYFILGLSLMVSLQISNAQTSAKKVEKAEKNLLAYQNTIALLESKMFDFEANKANPSGGKQVDLMSNPNFLNIRNDSAKCFMPFFGRAYNVSYGGGGGIEFEGLMTEYSLVKNDKKQSVTIKFRVLTSIDGFDCVLEVNRGKSGTLNINSQNRAFISYFGLVSEIKKK